MSITNTPLSEQIRIVLFGLRNAGKSSLMNNIFSRDVSIVSNVAGTTTDPVTKSIELGKLGPVAITDTAGLDDVGEIGELRIKKTLEFLEIADIAVLVTRADLPISEVEKKFVTEVKQKRKALIVALTFSDRDIEVSKSEFIKNYKYVKIDNLSKKGITELKNEIINLYNEIEFEISPLQGLVNENDLVVLVTPIDLAAPKGRLILPQVETIRDALDKDCAVLIVKERELKLFYDSLKIKPKLVVTDSQAFSKVAADIPPDQPLTSFSILFARKKGELALFVEGLRTLKNFPSDSKVMILEACSHHVQPDDIGTVKIPRLFRQLVQSNVEFEFLKELPEEIKLKEFKLVIHCGGCMVTRKKMLSRLEKLKSFGIPSLNYGLFLAWANGLIPRAIEPFAYEYSLYEK
ncbi:MAG: [FeFe] hydrogenase H-cluster maturation GTPase HydF [Brevinematales bacterium]|nr:[FeFe] hydrogenase H-cluster maturation GTPase HydF [Brevinematales bacterium]